MRGKIILILMAAFLVILGAFVAIGYFPKYSKSHAGLENQDQQVGAAESNDAVTALSGDDGTLSSIEERVHTSPEAFGTHGSPAHSLLPVEYALVSSGGLKVDVINKLISSDKFDEVMARIQFEGNADSLALTRKYGESLTAHLKSTDPNFSLNKLACGQTMCAAVMNGSIRDEDRFVSSALSMGENTSGGVRIYSAVAHMQPDANPDGSIAYRLVFTTDPNLNVLEVPSR